MGKKLLRNDDAFKQIPNADTGADMRHYGGANISELIPISVEEYLPDTTSLVHDFVTGCARFAFDNFLNRDYPGVWAWASRSIPRDGHGAAHSMRQLMFGIILHQRMLACNPGAFMDVLTIDLIDGGRVDGSVAGVGRKRLEEVDLLKRYLALSVAPLFNDIGRVHGKKVHTIPMQDGSYRWLFASILGEAEGGLLDAITSGSYGADSVFRHHVASFTMYRILMKHILNESGDDPGFSRFVDCVAAAGLYRLTVSKRNVFSSSNILDRFLLLNELVVGPEALDGCRDDTSDFYGTHSGRYYLYVLSLGECGEDGARNHVAEMESIVMHSINATLDFEGGNTTTVECAKDPMQYKGAKSIRSRKSSSARKVLLTHFDNIFYLLFNDFQAGKSARFDVRISTLLNPSLRRLRNRVFRFDVVAGAKKVVGLGKDLRYGNASAPSDAKNVRGSGGEVRKARTTKEVSNAKRDKVPRSLNNKDGRDMRLNDTDVKRRQSIHARLGRGSPQSRVPRSSSESDKPRSPLPESPKHRGQQISQKQQQKQQQSSSRNSRNSSRGSGMRSADIE